MKLSLRRVVLVLSLFLLSYSNPRLSPFKNNLQVCFFEFFHLIFPDLQEDRGEASMEQQAMVNLPPPGTGYMGKTPQHIKDLPQTAQHEVKLALC